MPEPFDNLVVDIIAGLIVAAILAGLGWLWRRGKSPTPSDAHAESGGVAVSRIEDSTVIVAQTGAIVNVYYDGLPQAKPQVRDPFEKGLRLQEAEQHEAAIRQFEKALASAEDDSQRCALHNLIGNRLRELGRPAEAEGHHRQAMDAAQKAQDKKGEAFALGNLALTYEDLREPDRAEERFEQSLAAFDKTGDRGSQAAILTHLATQCLKRRQPRKAKALAERAVALHPLEPGCESIAFLSLAALGQAWELLDDSREASRLYAKALQIADAVEDNAPWDPTVAAVLPDLREALERLGQE